MRDAIVIGCGIVGATIANALRKKMADILVIDQGNKMSGTRPSGGHLKPSWLGGMKKKDYEPALELLEETWGLIEEKFVVAPTGLTTTVYRVDTDQVMEYPHTQGTVTSIKHINNYPVVTFNRGIKKERQEEQCRMLIVAAGVWCGDLLPGIQIQAKQGVSFRLHGELSHPFIKPWAPYKQVVAHQQSEDEVWIGDGTAVLEKNWTEIRTVQCKTRCMRSLDAGFQLIKTTHGLRPYCGKLDGAPCLLKKVGQRAWVVTGAGKLGTIAAGWAARKIINTIY